MEPERKASFPKEFVVLFEAQFPRLARYLNRLTGDHDLASDLAQEALIRLYQRGSMPDRPEAWLVSVAMNLLRTFASTRTRRLKLLTDTRAEAALSDPPRAPDEGMEGIEERQRVRGNLERPLLEEAGGCFCSRPKATRTATSRRRFAFTRQASGRFW